MLDKVSRRKMRLQILSGWPFVLCTLSAQIGLWVFWAWFGRFRIQRRLSDKICSVILYREHVFDSTTLAKTFSTHFFMLLTVKLDNWLGIKSDLALAAPQNSSEKRRWKVSATVYTFSGCYCRFMLWLPQGFFFMQRKQSWPASPVSPPV